MPNRFHLTNLFLRGHLVRGASLSSQFVCGPSAHVYAPATDGGGFANRAIRSRIVANNALGTGTSASWNVTNFKCRVTVAPILISFYRRVLNVQWLTLLGSAICCASDSSDIEGSPPDSRSDIAKAVLWGRVTTAN